MCDREAAVDALLDVHDFQDIGHFANGDFAHNSLQVARGLGLNADVALRPRPARGDKRYKVEG